MSDYDFNEILEKLKNGGLPNLTGTSISLSQYEKIITVIDGLNFDMDYYFYKHLLQQRITPYSDLIELRNSLSADEQEIEIIRNKFKANVVKTFLNLCEEFKKEHPSIKCPLVMNDVAVNRILEVPPEDNEFVFV